MSRECGTASARQQGKAIAQSGGHLFGSKRRRAGRRKFDGERYAVELATDRCNRPQVSGARGRSPS